MTSDPSAVKKLDHLVVDSGAIIMGKGLDFFKSANKFWTVSEVISEIRDSKSRQLLDTLPYELEVKAPSENALRAVIDFARKTGDLSQLSMVDLKVLALTYDLEVEVHGTKFIRTEPVKSIRQQAKAPATKPVPTNRASRKNVESSEPFEEPTGDSCACCSGTASDSAATHTADMQAHGHEEIGHSSSPHKAEIRQPTASVHSHDHTHENHIDHTHDECSGSEDDECEEESSCEDDICDDNDETNSDHEVSVRFQDLEVTSAAEPVELNIDDEESFPGLGGDSTSKPKVQEQPTGGNSWAKVLKSQATPAPPKQVLITTVSTATQKSEPHATQLHGEAYFGSSSTPSDEAPKDTTSRILRSTGVSEYTSEKSNALRAEQDDGENWISPSNIASCRISGSGMMGSSRAQSVHNAHTLNQAKVACVTTDFSMENVLLQMGLKLMSVEGRLIHRLKQWVLRCAACFHVHYETDKLFCTNCGNSMLQRIAASIDSKTGELRLHLKANYRHNTRGMIHSLPKPGSQGRYDGELLLREDQMFSGIWRQKVAKIKHDVKSAFGDDITHDVGLQLNKKEYGIKIGLGRRNPNADKGRERRGAKKKNKH